MKRILLAGIAALAIAAPAQAADLPTKGPAVYAPALFNWSGFYIGGYVGGAWTGNVTASDLFSQGGVFPVGTPYNISVPYSYSLSNSFIGGLTAGVNWQAPGASLVLGIEGEVGWLRLRGSRADPLSPGLDTVSTTTIGNWYGVIAGRLGFAMDRALLYGKAGVVIVNVSGSTIDACVVGACGVGLITATGNDTKFNWVGGLGLEWAFTNKLSLKAEYLYLAIGGNVRVCGLGPAGSTFCGTHSLPNGVHTAKVGLNWRM